MTDASLYARKIFPRNLTARAATPVRGNPANARPESGVDNTHPGLEFDQRNLDQAFFPGLTFEFQFLTGARLVGINPGIMAPGQQAFPDRLTAADIDDCDDNKLHLLYLWGSFGAQRGGQRLVQLYGVDGYEVLRTVRDLEPGPLLVFVGRKLASNDPASLPDKGALLSQYADAINGAAAGTLVPALALPPVRDAHGKLLAAMLVGSRAHFLDSNGVIMDSVAGPGDLTRSLCAPWQWDFADCGCHYWAANKPDIVFGEDGAVQELNFQRDRSKPVPARPATTIAAWTKDQMTQPAMIRDWERLPFVIAERETSRALRPEVARSDDLWSRDRIIAELTYLGTIEHALAIEYLYAYYSLDAPREPPAASAGDMVRDMFTAAQVVRTIAVDEMRHFRWVNEALQLLGAPICLARATRFAEGPNKIAGSFDLLPLTPDRLDYFIAVEAPSRSRDDPSQLDGLYTHLLTTLENQVADIPAANGRRIAELVKLIIDEGHEHWERFSKVKAMLAKYSPEAYLRVKGPPAAGCDSGSYLDDLRELADNNYADLLAGLEVAFGADPVARASHIAGARLLMYNLDDVGVELATKGIGMAFTMPPTPEAVPPPGADRSALDDRLRSASDRLQALAARADPALAALIDRQRDRIAAVATGLRRIAH